MNGQPLSPPARLQPAIPSKETLLAFIRERSGNVGTKEVARAFGLKNADRAVLRGLLRELADEGQIENRRKKYHKPGTLPPVVLCDITGRDRDGELIGDTGGMGQRRTRPCSQNPCPRTAQDLAEGNTRRR